MCKNLVMSFLNKEGRKTNITLNNVKADITIDLINTAMDTIIDKNIFVSKGGDLVSKDSAKLVTKTEKDFTLN